MSLPDSCLCLRVLTSLLEIIPSDLETNEGLERVIQTLKGFESEIDREESPWRYDLTVQARERVEHCLGESKLAADECLETIDDLIDDMLLTFDVIWINSLEDAQTLQTVFESRPASVLRAATVKVHEEGLDDSTCRHLADMIKALKSAEGGEA